MGKFVTKMALVLFMVFGMAVSVSAEEAKADTKKANVFGSKAQNGWLKDFEYRDDWCWNKSTPKFLAENEITKNEADKQCIEYLKEEIKLLIPYAEERDGKKCNIDMDDKRGGGRSDSGYCWKLKGVLKTLNYFENPKSAGDKIREIEIKLLTDW